MINIENVTIYGLEEAVRGMRNPMNSWEKSDSGFCKGGDNGIWCMNCAECGCGHEYDYSWKLGKADHELMMKLAAGGPVHAKYRRMIAVYLDVTAPLYWWKEFDTYKVGTVANSCSTMHKIHEKEFKLDDFSHEHLNIQTIEALKITVDILNFNRALYLNYDANDFEINGCPSKKDIWWQIIQLLPSSYNQLRTVMLNYEVLAGIYPMRKYHKLDEWRDFCQWIETLPYSEIITCNAKEVENDD